MRQKAGKEARRGMLRFAGKEQEALNQKFNELYRYYRNLMFHVAYGILNDVPDAEDAVQQAFLSIYKNLKKISEIQCPKTRSFVVIITERKAIDLLRSRKRHSTVELNEDIAGITIRMPGEYGLSGAMARLPARYREVLLLRFDNGFSTKEVASMLGMSLTATQKTITRAKEMLRKELEKEEADDERTRTDG